MENVSVTLANNHPVSPSADAGMETFTDLCKQLGRRINGTENALLCVRAYRAYLIDHPHTAQGQGNNSDRDASEKSFRHAAAEESGVSPSTIDALLQVGKAIEPMPADLKTALASSSLLSIRMLRKLATKKFDSNRETLIKNFIEEEKSDPEVARAHLEAELGKTTSKGGQATKKVKTNKPRESNEHTSEVEKDVQGGERKVVEHTYELAAGEQFEMQVGGYHVRVEIQLRADGRILARTMTCQGDGNDGDDLEKVLPTNTEAHTKEEATPSSGEQESKAA